MAYNIKVALSPFLTYGQFEEWKIQEAYPTFYIDIIFYKKKQKELTFKIKIEGNYYYWGSINFNIRKMKLDKCEINDDDIDKDKVNELLRSKNMERKMRDAIKGSLLSDNDPIEILELIWDQF